MFNKILIANRGEIACRIIRSCRKLGIRSVAVYSDVDASAQHVRLADEAWPIGGPRPQESYLRGEAIIEVAKQSGAQAIHPGYGFLSENADFAEAVEAAGIVFIGPKAASMRKMGSKAGAKDLMASFGVPVVPGYTGENQESGTLHREANRIGYPLMIKAAHGGGGKGMRIVRTSAEFLPALASCQREAKNAFGKDRVLLERYIEQPRHIEFQIFADAHGQTIHLGERECSAQRRYQKIIEESPSPFLTPDLRTQMGVAAVQAAQAIDYVNAGTVEFIVGADGDFYFMEINTRLQVEHPVTEMVTGLDLVEWQLRIAAGKALPLVQNQIQHHGHAMEVRLYAEDPEKEFLPGSGKLQALRLPQSNAHVRIDSAVIEGDTVTIFYDPMIAKLIVWDEDRPRVLARLREALADCEIIGLKSNIEFLEQLIRHPIVIEGRIDTGYLDQHLQEVLPASTTPNPILLTSAIIACLLHDEIAVPTKARQSNDPYSPWAIADGWRLGHAGQRFLCFEHSGERIEVTTHGSAGNYSIETGKQHFSIANAHRNGGFVNAQIDDRTYRYRAHANATSVLVHDGEHRLVLARLPAFLADTAQESSVDNRVLTPMPGRIVLIKVQEGDVVIAGQEVCVMEAMKMELSLKAPRAGSIRSVQACVGDFVDADTVLVTLIDEPCTEESDL